MRASNTVTEERQIASRAFTLIELLTVIAIIAVLASLSVGVSAIVARKSKISRTRAELGRLDLAIRDYKAHFGFYPPDNVIRPEELTQDPVVNQLYYELSGAVYDVGDDEYEANGAPETDKISRTAYRQAFGNNNLAGIYNSSASAANTKNFLKAARSTQTRRITLDSYPQVSPFTYTALVVPVAFPVNHWKTRLDPTDPQYDARFFPPLHSYSSDPLVQAINPWHYNTTNPTNNPGEFDLWADIVVGDDFITIGNWKEE